MAKKVLCILLILLLIVLIALCAALLIRTLSYDTVSVFPADIRGNEITVSDIFIIEDEETPDGPDGPAEPEETESVPGLPSAGGCPCPDNVIFCM